MTMTASDPAARTAPSDEPISDPARGEQELRPGASPARRGPQRLSGPGHGARGRQRGRQEHLDQGSRRHPQLRLGQLHLRGQGRARHATPDRRTRSASRSSTRTLPCATTWTSSTTCSWGARSPRTASLTRATWSGGPTRPSRACRCAPSSRSGSSWPACRAASARPSPSRGRSCGTLASSSSTSRPPLLGVAQTEQVLRLVRRLADRGLGVILISHNMNDVLEVADNIAVLYLGQMVAQIPASR